MRRSRTRAESVRRLVRRKLETPDIVVNRLQLALRGLGGPNCNPATGTPGSGSCLWFNPFSNGVARSAVTGNANPFFAGNSNSAVVNSPEVIDWMHQYRVDDRESNLLVADLVFNGDMPVQLGGGKIAWAVGAQWRDSTQIRELNDLNDIDVSPCVDDATTARPRARADPVRTRSTARCASTTCRRTSRPDSSS